MKFCKDCRCYRQMKDAEHDLCTHHSAVIDDHRRDVRGEEIPIAFYSCFAMRSGICHEGKLFIPANNPYLDADGTLGAMG